MSAEDVLNEDRMIEQPRSAVVRELCYLKRDYSADEDYLSDFAPIDYLADEAAFFQSCLSERADDETLPLPAASGRDSGLGMNGEGELAADGQPVSSRSSKEYDSGRGSSRRELWDKRPETVKVNQSRGTNTPTVGEKRGYQKNMLLVSLLQSSVRAEQFSLTQKRVASHLVQFLIQPCFSQSIARTSPALFVLNVTDQLVVNAKYRFPERVVFSKQQDSYLYNLCSALVPSHIQLRDLVQFADNQKELLDSECPVFIKTWLYFFDNFLLEYETEMKRVQTRIAVPAVVIGVTSDMRDRVALLHSIIRPVQAARSWNWKEVEFAWSNLIKVTGCQYGLSSAQLNLATQLQKLFLPVLLTTLDKLYQTGRVPENMQTHFILYNDLRHPDRLLTRVEKENEHFVMWTDALLNIIVKGVRLRNMLLGVETCPSSSTMFTDGFDRVLESLNLTTGFISRYSLQYALENVATELRLQFDSELFVLAKDAGLVTLWEDLRKITIGKAAQLFANGVIAGRQCFKHRRDDVFRSALTYGRVSNVVEWSRLASPGYIGEITCKAKFPLSVLLRSSLMRSVNSCLDFWLQLNRMEHLLSDTIKDGVSYCRVETGLKRRFQFVVNNLHFVIELIRDQFCFKVESIFDRMDNKLASTGTFGDVEDAFYESELELRSLVDREGNRKVKDILEIIDVFVALVDDIRLTSLGGNLNDDVVADWRRTMLRSFEYLTSLGRNLPNDNIFHTLYVKMRYIPASARL